MRKRRHLTIIGLALAVMALSWGMGQAQLTLQVDTNGYYIPDYFNTPNWANSPALPKFVDPLPGLYISGVSPAPAAGAQYMPVAVADKTTYPGSDYYEIELGEYTQLMHSGMGNPTKLRGYRQTNAPDAAVNQFHYLGPMIIVAKGTPVRVKFTNSLPVGDHFLPVDPTIMGAGEFMIDYDPATKAAITPISGMFSQNRATLHLHGGLNPWISDGTAHQWTAPAGVTDYPKGVGVGYVPDMWFDAAGNTIASCAGLTTCAVAGATNNPGAGKLTFYWTNDQSARLMFYHDHAYGITRLNVYAGEAAGYLINDPALEDSLAALGVPGTLGTTPDYAHVLPLIIQDKTFVDAANIMTTDPTWAWGTNPGKPVTTTPVTGDLWWPHVYMPAQNPYNPDLTGINMMGRWMYGPWFFPPTPVCGSSVDAVKPYCIDVGTVANEYYVPTCDPTLGFCQPFERPGTTNPSWGAEAFLDTMVVNGTAYPTVAVEPGKYRLRILNASHDRYLNLQLYRAVSKVGYTNPTVAPYTYTGAATDLTEVAMVPAAAVVGYPANWPTDGREGGVPDPATRGPAFIQIGTEGGVLPKPVMLPTQPVQWNQDPTMFNVGNVLQQRDGGGTLLLGPAERADVIVDFTNFAGQTLILYNDAPAAFPALDPHYDYYTGAPDRTEMGGYGPVLPGVGPNVRTVMQITVSGAGGTAPPDDYNPTFLSSLQTAFASPTGIFASTQHPIVVGQTAYNTAYSHTFPAIAPNWGLSTIFNDAISFETVNPDKTTFTLTSNYPMERKAIHDEMGGTFDNYGRMSAKLGLEVPFANAAIQNFILQNFIDPVTEIVKTDEIQIWRITHNGVDTHPMHFHLFDVQVINRVGWDGFIRLPDDNELGWKDTVRVAPLEDTIVALRPVKPTVPFKLPNSIRPLNPTMPLGDTMDFSQLDIVDGGDLVPAMTNQMVNFGAEYTWHCHILSHEENDMMRPTVLALPPDAAPTGLAAVRTGNGTNRRVALTWTDNSVNETSFVIERATDQAFTQNLVSPLATVSTASNGPTTGLRSYSDPIGNTNQAFWYRVYASNTVGGTNPVTNYPSVTIDSAYAGPVTFTATSTTPAEPSNVTATAARSGRNARVTLRWTDNANNETGFRVQWSRNRNFTTISGTSTIGANNTRFTTQNISRRTAFYFRIQAFNTAGSSAWVNATPFPITTP